MRDDPAQLAHLNSGAPIVAEVSAEVRRPRYLHTKLYLTLVRAAKMLRAWVAMIWPLRNDSETPGRCAS